jgi:hypothetical protein
LTSYALRAEVSLTATCGEPVGTRYDQVQGQIKQEADRFSGANPILVWNESEGAERMTVRWGDAEWAKKAGIQPKVGEGTVVIRNQSMISAVVIDGLGAVEVYSMYPQDGLVYFTQHRYINAMDGVPNSSSFYAKCTFVISR